MQKDEWYNIVRTTDPETSKSAAKQEISRVLKAKDRVLQLLVEQGGSKGFDDGMTSEELERYDNVTTSKYRTAIKKLCDAGHIIAFGTRLSSHNKQQRIWFASDQGIDMYNKIKRG
tara:strand:- start:310 stop:657 length:348 start_codon:yes stop_codon:yes gene_type:complete